MKKEPQQNKNGAKEWLDHLNTTFARLHKAYEEDYWQSYMGDHSVDKRMNEAQEKRDAFRSDPKLKAETERLVKQEKGHTKERLQTWIRFFSMYQTPKEAEAIRKEVSKLEAGIMKKRTERIEGYIDPKTGQFVQASENKMRAMMRTDSDEVIRKACFEAMQKLPLDTINDYIKMIGLRNRFAKILGFEDFYAYKARIDEDMTKKELFSVFDAIYEKTKYALKDIRKMEETKPGLRKPWNFAYMLSGDFTKEEDPYFRFENVLSYWGESFAALGIGFSGGSISLDLLDRQGKWNNGFCHYPVLVQYKNGKRTPGASNFASTAIPDQVGSGIQGLHTVFHEGGHAADRLGSYQEDVCINTEYPPSTVSWAETHSMFLEAVSNSIEWRVRYARNASGKPYPFALYEKRLRALYPLRPLGMMGISSVVEFEKQIYECKNLTKGKVLDIANKVNKKYQDLSEDSVMILNVPHIYNWESSAYYHGYGLAELTVCQWREYFFKKYRYIVDNKNVGKEIMKIWSYASLHPAKKLIKMAMGKPLSAQAFIRDATMPLGSVLKRAKERVERMSKVQRYNKPIDLDGKIAIVHGKKKIADNSKSFEDMDTKFRAWLKTVK